MHLKIFICRTTCKDHVTAWASSQLRAHCWNNLRRLKCTCMSIAYQSETFFKKRLILRRFHSHFPDQSVDFWRTEICFYGKSLSFASNFVFPNHAAFFLKQEVLYVLKHGCQWYSIYAYVCFHKPCWFQQDLSLDLSLHHNCCNLQLAWQIILPAW